VVGGGVDAAGTIADDGAANVAQLKPQAAGDFDAVRGGLPRTIMANGV
jgi:hypothetical protein